MMNIYATAKSENGMSCAVIGATIGEAKDSFAKTYRDLNGRGATLDAIAEMIERHQNENKITVYTSDKYICQAYNNQIVQNARLNDWKIGKDMYLIFCDKWDRILRNDSMINFVYVGNTDNIKGKQEKEEMRKNCEALTNLYNYAGTRLAAVMGKPPVAVSAETVILTPREDAPSFKKINKEAETVDASVAPKPAENNVTDGKPMPPVWPVVAETAAPVIMDAAPEAEPVIPAETASVAAPRRKRIRPVVMDTAPVDTPAVSEPVSAVNDCDPDFGFSFDDIMFSGNTTKYYATEEDIAFAASTSSCCTIDPDYVPGDDRGDFVVVSKTVPAEKKAEPVKTVEKTVVVSEQPAVKDGIHATVAYFNKKDGMHTAEFDNSADAKKAYQKLASKGLLTFYKSETETLSANIPSDDKCISFNNMKVFVLNGVGFKVEYAKKLYIEENKFGKKIVIK